MAISITPSGAFGFFSFTSFPYISSFSSIISHTAPSRENSPRYTSVLKERHRGRRLLAKCVFVCASHQHQQRYAICTHTFASQYLSFASIKITALRHCHLCPKVFLPPILRMVRERTSPADSSAPTKTNRNLLAHRSNMERCRGKAEIAH